MNKIDKRLHFLLGKVKEECKKVKELSDYELKNVSTHLLTPFNK